MIFRWFQYLVPVSACLVFLTMTGCAPQTDGEGGEPDPTPIPVPDTKPVEPAVATPTPVASVPTPTPQPRATFDPQNPDWSLRYRMLKDHFAGEFEPKDTVIGTRMKIPLENGAVREGVIAAIHENSLDLDIENGTLNLHADSLREDAQKYFFREYFAHLSAVEQARGEHANWKAMQARSVRPAPTPQRLTPSSPVVPRTMPDRSNPDGLTHRYRPNPRAEPPKNEGPKGRVWQVDQYLRKNSAIPHSLRYKKWFPVQKHGRGYKVRVQYSVESAADLGTSHEDMMFFMHADGRVYQRAAVK